MSQLRGKFNKHLSSGGLIYVFIRAIKYFIFMFRHKNKTPPQESYISSGPLRILVGRHGIQLFWFDKCLTCGCGLNVGINTLGLWTDSSKADWKLIEKNQDTLRVRINFNEIPLIQTWKINICDHDNLIWEIESQNTEWLHIDELRILCLLSPQYTCWFYGYEHGAFSGFKKDWQEFKFEDPASLAGVRFPVEASGLPAFALEENSQNSKMLIQNSSYLEKLRIIGFRFPYRQDKGDLAQGSRQEFKVNMRVFENDIKLDSKIELFRKKELTVALTSKNITGINGDKKVALVNLPWYKNGASGVRAGSRWPHTKDSSEGSYMPFPFFLAYAAALLEKNKINVKFIDAIAEGLTESVFMDRLSDGDIGYLVAETSVPSFYQDMQLLKKISACGIKIILCGPNSLIYQPDFMYQYHFVDFVLVGEYEFTLLELIKAVKNRTDLSGVQGIIYRDKNRILRTGPRQLCDIDSLPWPHRESLPMDKYWDTPGDIPYPSVQMLASRGCPFNCSFCLWPQVMYQGNSYRARSVEDVVDEMEYLVKEKGFKSVYFDDDTFNIGKERILKFCRALKKRGLENIPWAIMARADLMDGELLGEMKSAGLCAVKYGVESCAQDLVEKSGKNMNLDKTSDIIKVTKDLGIKVHLTFCFGLPGETKESIDRTIDFALSQDSESVQFSILTPFPGTKLFEELDSKGKILTKDWSKYDGHYSCVFEPEGLSVEDLELAKHKAYCRWHDAKCRQRGLRGDLQRFLKYLNEYGIFYVIRKTFDYLWFLCFKRRRYLDGTAR